MKPKRILFVFAWLVVGGEETEVRLLAKNLDSKKYTVEVLACFRKEGMPEQTHKQLEALGIPVDTTPYTLSFEDTASYLVGKLPDYDIVVATQAVPDVYPALEKLSPAKRPVLIEHGGLVEEALKGLKHLTARYVGVCGSIRDAAASKMPGREEDALVIPSMVDLSEFGSKDRDGVRLELRALPSVPVFGMVGRLDRKKNFDVFIEAAAVVRDSRPDARFVIIGGPDAFMPEYEDELKKLAANKGLEENLSFLGDRDDVPRLLAGLDVLVWLSEGEGMPHVIAEAGAAGLAVIATPDNGVLEQLTDLETGLFVPYHDVNSTAKVMLRLAKDKDLRNRLGDTLQRKVEREYSVDAVIAQWEELFDSVLSGTERNVTKGEVYA